MALEKYNQKRNFKTTPEPKGVIKRSGKTLKFVVQKHFASHLHYDFRLELDGVLKSWAVPKGPSLDNKVRRLAAETEDHPVAYADFEGTIPSGEYGAGTMTIWDEGTWIPETDPNTAYKKGKLDFELFGSKLRGRWTLIKLKDSDKYKKSWFLFKRTDEHARAGSDITSESPDPIKRAKKTEPPQRSAKTKTIRKTTQKRKSKQPSNHTPPPKFIKPQLAQLMDTVPIGDEWFHEIKFDGYRTLARIENETVQLLTRSGLDWTKKYGSLKDDILKLPTTNAFLDGEIVWVDGAGKSDFGGLQRALSEGRTDRMAYYVFDLLHLDGEDLRDRPLHERKQILKNLLKGSKTPKILFSEHFINLGPDMLRESCSLQMEGIISKNSNATYLSTRSPAWQKIKCSSRQEFVIGGFLDSGASGRSLKSLLMGVYDGKELLYTGKIGTGFTQSTLSSLRAKLTKLECEESPFKNAPRMAGVHWVEPLMVAEVEFRGWTDDGSIRHGSFLGLRDDKKASVVRKEVPKKQKSTKVATPIPAIGGDLVAGVKITHPDRVVYPKTKTSKMELIKYYDAVFDYIEPFLNDRPLSLLRCQQTSTGTCFFQKHADGKNLEARSQRVHYKEKSDTAIVAETKRELIKLIQAGTIELHGWQGCFGHITKPDLIVFDLDPETEKIWPLVVSTAHRIRAMLTHFELKSYVKVTGGKGLHIHVPIIPNYSWDEVKQFSKSLMEVLEQEEPKNYTTNMIKARRKNRIFLDYLRNGYGSTAVLPYSVRARGEPTVALPISWSEVTNNLNPAKYTVQNAIKTISNRKDPWADYWDVQQQLNVFKKTP